MTTLSFQIYTLRDGSINSMSVDLVLGRLYIVLNFGDIKVIDFDGKQYQVLQFVLGLESVNLYYQIKCWLEENV